MKKYVIEGIDKGIGDVVEYLVKDSSLENALRGFTQNNKTFGHSIKVVSIKEV